MATYLCITGTDTNVGKTVITAGIARLARQRGMRTLIVKAVQTGAIRDVAGHWRAPDLDLCAAAAPGSATEFLALFEEACSPHLAAKELGRRLTADELAQGVLAKSSEGSFDLILLEGAGGLLTPVNESETFCDVFTALGWPMLLVAANKLGSVNHALLTLETLKRRGLPCLGTVMNQTSEDASPLASRIRLDNSLVIRQLGSAACLAETVFSSALQHPDPTAHAEAWDKLALSLAPVLEAVSLKPALPPKPFLSGEALLAYDREHIWHPYTSACSPVQSWEAVSTAGTRIRLRDGRELIDGMASWWCVIHGYRRAELMEAANAQMARMPHVMFGGLTHAPAATLAQKLLEIAPQGFEHVFFADSGSVAVEAAIKMALQYHQAKGARSRTRLLSVRGGYHGDTLGAMSVSDPENGMHSLFSGVLPRQLFAPRPACRFDAPYDPSSAKAFAELLEKHAKDIAAVILEPIVQGAGGMWFYHPEYLRKVSALCKEAGCLLILDEIATGFGRTGTLFACEHAGVSSDILCVGKGLTGGVLSLAAVLATRDVAEGVSSNGGVFMHGPTFMGNPLACSVAKASLDVLDSGPWKASVRRIEKELREGLCQCCELDGVADVRVLGAIGVVEMSAPVNTAKLQAYFVEDCGVWIRPFGKLIYVMPPYIADSHDIDVLTSAIRKAILGGQWR